MAGFLDSLKIDDPATAQGLLQFGLSLLQSKGGLANALGAAGMQGLQGSQQFRDRANAQKRQGMMDQLTQQQIAAGKRQQAMQELPGQFTRAPSEPGIDATGGMDTALTNPNNAAGPGGFDANGYTQALRGLDPEAAFRFEQMTRKAGPQIHTFKPGETAGTIEGGKFNPIFSAPDKADKGTSDMQEFDFAMKRGEVKPGTTFTQWMRDNKKAGASSVSVNTGQKGFDNTLKLRGDFRSEPIYKAHQEVQSAYAQIGQALKQASPAGDLAGATKIMKLLDPGSVVRESELGMAMAATGLMDRVQNYATNIMAGTKLTPTQRKDFQRLADALYGESVKQYNAKQGEYKGISERNGLNTTDVIGAPQAMPGNGFKYLGPEK